MNCFEIKPKVILVSESFIVFCLAVLQFVEADLNLPNKDRLNAITCVRDFFGEAYNQKFVAEKENTLSDGEYLGAICDGLSPDDFERLIKNEPLGTYDYDGKGIRECLTQKNYGTLFEKYHSIGVDLPKNADKQKTIDVPRAEIPEDTSPEYSELSSSKIYAFLNGLCQSSKEEVEFATVKGDEEKKEVLSCLVQCTGKFMERIENILVLGKVETIRLINFKINLIENRKVVDPNSDKEAIEEENSKAKLRGQIKNLDENAIISNQAKSFGEEYYEKSIWSKGIHLIEKKGLHYLANYSDFYNHLNEYVNNYDKQTDDRLGNVDNDLYASFSLYQNCSKIGCGMNLIREGAKDPDRTSSKIFEYLRAIAEENKWYTPKKRAFFKALSEIQNLVSGTESASQED